MRTVESPCPHSTPALWTSATGPSGPAESVTRASWKSSNPSLYAMFLYPSANPTPRLRPSPRPTLPAPPGNVIGSRIAGGSGSGGIGIAAHRSMTSRTGALPRST